MLIKVLFYVCMRKFIGLRINGNVSWRMVLFRLVARIGYLAGLMGSLSGSRPLDLNCLWEGIAIIGYICLQGILA